jgi:hypothetical protein
VGKKQGWKDPFSDDPILACTARRTNSTRFMRRSSVTAWVLRVRSPGPGQPDGDHNFRRALLPGRADGSALQL